jgi:hypothetical protein
MALSDLKSLVTLHSELTQRAADHAKAAAEGSEKLTAVLLEQRDADRKRLQERIVRLEGSRKAALQRMDEHLKRDREALAQLDAEIGTLRDEKSKKPAGGSRAKEIKTGGKRGASEPES